MSKSIKIVMALGLLTLASACADRASEEVVYVDEPAPMVQAEPVYNKY